MFLAVLTLAAWVAWAAGTGPALSFLDGQGGLPAGDGSGGLPAGDGEAGSGGNADPGGGQPGPGAGTHLGDDPAGGGGVVDPEGGWMVLVDVATQRVHVYRGQELVRTMVCSTGTGDKPTPLGEFKIQHRGEWFFSEKYKQGGKWWVSFHNWGEYLFHSVPMDRQGRILEEEAARLGQPASHGCVRLSLEDAEWFYRHIPAGTPVIIR